VVGEKILRLEERLGYKHKGVEKLFERMDPPQGARLAGRISGDSTVAYAWAYAQAVEGASRTAPPARALWLRALLLERERMANHLGDLGAIGNDAGLAFGLAQFSRLKEDLLRTNQALFGHRYLMDAIIPGGVARDLLPAGNNRLISEMRALTREIKNLQEIYYEHAGLQDRFITTGQIAPELAARLGLTGLAGRASGQAWDNRAQYPCEPYTQLEVRMMTHRNGDVAARVIVRFEELYESLRLGQEILAKLPPGEIFTPLNSMPAGSRGLGWVEGWRGEVLLAVQTGPEGRIRRAFAHDPSWQNWPALEYAVMGNIVPDFPLINKSFNLSYSGHDL
jgi:Ni,Fe-hydrogenase III large subunit